MVLARVVEMKEVDIFGVYLTVDSLRLVDGLTREKSWIIF